MAKHHPDLIFCRKQAGVGELVPCSLLFEWDGMRNWGLGGFTSSFGLWFWGLHISRLTVPGYSGSALRSVASNERAGASQIALDLGGFRTAFETEFWYQAKFRGIGRAW